MSLNMAGFAAALKTRYDLTRMAKEGYEERPLFALLRKVTNATGDFIPLPIKYGNPQNTGAIYNRSERSAPGAPGRSNGAYGRFNLTRTKKYGFAFLDRETIKASMGNASAFAAATDVEIQGAYDGVADGIHRALFRSGDGSIGQLSAVAGTLLTFANPEDVDGLEVGTSIQLTTGATATAALRSDIRTVTGIDPDAGAFTLDVAVTGASATDWVVKYGNRIDSALASTSDYVDILGLDAWFPAVAPGGADSFNGINRSQHATRLAGNRVPFGGTIKATLMNASIAMGRGKAKRNKVCFMNDTDMQTLFSEYDAKLEHSTLSSVGSLGVGFEAYHVRTNKGVIKVVADHQCPVGVAYALDMDRCALYSLGETPHVVTDDKNASWVHISGEDGYQISYASYHTFGCERPGSCARLALS